jgi:hypothetical protein
VVVKQAARRGVAGAATEAASRLIGKPAAERPRAA